MAILRVAFLALLVAAALADDSCPTSQELSPCTCDGEGLNCMGQISLDNIRKAFRSNFKYGGVRAVWIQGTPITEIPAGLFGNTKSQQFYIEVNNVTKVDMSAFSASQSTLNLLSMFGNKISSFPFKDLNTYQKLGTLNLGRNQITSIPDNAFDNRYLFTLILTQNKISSIGRNAFSKLPNLSRLELALNSLATLGPMSFAFPSHSNTLQINVAANQISEVDPTAFDGAAPQLIYMSQNKMKTLKADAFQQLATRVLNRGGMIEVSSNPFTCRGCDFSWLVVNKAVLHDRFPGFMCEDQRMLRDLTMANIGC